MLGTSRALKIEANIDPSGARAGARAVNRLLACLRKLFGWAVEVDLLEVNPCIGVRAPGRESARDRVLSIEEIGELWERFTPGPNLTEPVVAALRMILATAQRPGEVCSMRWADVDESAAVWTIPATAAKNGLAHRVPLNGVALELLKARPDEAQRGSSEYVFPSRRAKGLSNSTDPSLRRGRPIAGAALAHALRRNRALPEGDERRLTIEPSFGPHDLRRTAASMMTSNGVTRLVVGLVLNHVESGVTRVYDRHSYDSEKRQALDVWGRVLAVATGQEQPEEARVVEMVRPA